MRIAEDSLELDGNVLDSRIRGPVLPENAQSSRVRVDAAEHLVMLQPQLDGPITSHGETANRSSRSFGTDRKRSVYQPDHVLDQVVLVSISDLGVSIPAAASVRHDHHQ